MTSIVLIETNGTVKALKAKDLTPESLYKKCSFRTNDDFKCQHTWKVKMDKTTYIISVWAKTVGKATFENKYDFPPPMDNTLFFGTCALVQNDTEGNFIDLTDELWLKIYEHLFGGFEDLGDEDEYSEDELANVDPSLLTANGYLKDGFVVSDTEVITPPLTPPLLNNKKGESKSKALKCIGKEKAVKTKAVKIKAVKIKAETSKAETSKAETSKAETSKAETSKAGTSKAGTSKAGTSKAGTSKAVKGKAIAAPAPSTTSEESDIDDSTSELEEEMYTFTDEE
jgi:hypothetical protein